MMRRISSSATLLLKLFLPTLWIVFFGCLTIALCYMALNGKLGSAGRNVVFISLITGGYLGGVVILYFTLLQLKRVELDEEYFYITNYFRTYRYPMASIKKITETDYYLWRTATIHFFNKSSFGRSVTLLQSRQKFDDFIKSEPRVEHLLG